ncbi:hypothetical protein IEO21_03573 [Rhodonia placenta]|uniref:T6SS Phospholipase effector Tle1-like catalytic domain-containing protein n=1 Tax=Rhodonia placenta TaxID=104341 RepID=A0A8H7P5H7_9APHY|nr:hypothetical protein IEO21_03573 [Postia placenta]
MSSNKMLLVFCDGTGMDGTLSEPDTDNPSFFLKPLFLKENSDHQDGRRQIVFYQSGVGSEAAFNGDPAFGGLILSLFGVAVASKIRDAYAFIAQNFEEGDEICIFGGAYSARKLAGLIDRIGLLSRVNLGQLFAIWSALNEDKTPTIPSDTRKVNISCVGVWDTVGSVFRENNALDIKDNSLPESVDVALHALSFHENRLPFLPTLWEEPKGGLRKGQILKQRWFPGAHADVGGGYEHHELSDISLFWMAGEIQNIVNLDLDFLRASAQRNPDPWGTSQPHNTDLEVMLGLLPCTRLTGKRITPNSTFHESLLYSPDSLKEPLNMITLDIVEEHFGTSFMPQFAPLNDFEQQCKDHWGELPVRGSRMVSGLILIVFCIEDETWPRDILSYSSESEDRIKLRDVTRAQLLAPKQAAGAYIRQVLLVFCDGTGMDGNLSNFTKLAYVFPFLVGFVFFKLNAQFAALDRPQTTSRSSSRSQVTAHNKSPPEASVRSQHELPVAVLAVELMNSIAVRGGSSTQFATNVLRLSRAVYPYTVDKRKQIVFYQSGVGSEANFAGDQVTGTTAMPSKIRDAYAFIAQNFEDGDEICLFGGAYTARKLGGLIDAIGLLTRKNLGRFFQIWHQLTVGETPTIPSDTRKTRIKCIGVWDTVGSVYGEIDALSITDTSLPGTVDVALHALSLQENRKKFLPTLWEKPKGGLGANQILKQVWFAGAHSDVGGGYERHELADIALFWIIILICIGKGEIKSFINLDLEFLLASKQPQPQPWGTSQPHNAYEELPFLEKPVIGQETRLESKQITADSVLHASIEFSPQKLDSPDYMVTLEKLVKEFGPSFKPQYPPLNEFEEYCRDNWKDLPRGIPYRPVFEQPGDLFGFSAGSV